MIKILILAANPKDTTPLRLGDEVRAIREKLLRSDLREEFEIVHESSVRVVDLQAHLLRHRPHIVHFSGHGFLDCGIVMEDQSGNSMAVAPVALQKLFSILKDNIQCVVLNACFSKIQADAIALSIGCVVAMSVEIADQAAIAFSECFYQAIAYGKSIKSAFDLACLQIETLDLGQHDIPMLVTRPGMDPELTTIAEPKATDSAALSTNREGTSVTINGGSKVGNIAVSNNGHITQAVHDRQPSGTQSGNRRRQ